jgi:hypothetical protein
MHVAYYRDREGESLDRETWALLLADTTYTQVVSHVLELREGAPSRIVEGFWLGWCSTREVVPTPFGVRIQKRTKVGWATEHLQWLTDEQQVRNAVEQIVNNHGPKPGSHAAEGSRDVR